MSECRIVAESGVPLKKVDNKQEALKKTADFSNFEVARSQLELRKNIQEDKANIMGGIGAEQREIIDEGFKRLEELRKTEEGVHNEEVIKRLAVELGLDPIETMNEFNQGLQYDIRAAYRLGMIGKESGQESLDAVLGAYVLN